MTVVLTADELADRTRRAMRAAMSAARELGVRARTATVLHDVFSVVVHLEPEPVVARIPVVSTGDESPQRQIGRQQRELDVAAWLHRRGVPVIPPSPRLPRRPVRRDGFSMTFWELADLAPDHEPYRGVDACWSAELHARLADYPGALPFLAPFNHGLPDMMARLDTVSLLTTDDVARAHAEFASLRAILADRATFERTFPGVTTQPIQGDCPSHNVIRTMSGICFSDFEDVCEGPVEWDLALMGPQTTADYNRAVLARGLRRTDPSVQLVMDAARRLQFLGALTLIPRLPVLAQGLAEALDEWRASPQVGRP